MSVGEEKIMREVVGEERKPFDRDSRGNILYVYFDVLECGHKIKKHNPSLRAINRTADMVPTPTKTRRCKRCEDSA